MMRVLVTGGTGALGCQVVQRLRAAGHRALVASRRPAPADEDRVVLDLATGEGLAGAVEGVDAVVHAASSPYTDTRAVDVRGTGRLLEACATAGVAHLAFISIVGCDQIPASYYEAKAAAEALVEQGAVPWSILRATQFHTLLDRFLGPFRWLPGVPAPRGWQVQPVDPDVVADALADVALGEPQERCPDLGGPEVLTVRQIVRTWIEAREAWQCTLPVPVPGAASRAVRQGRLCLDGGETAGRTWARWCAAQTA